MVMKVYGSALSTAAMRVFAALYEKDLEFEFVPVDMGAGEHKKDHFLALNPFGQVPAFEDGYMKLFESRAITRYIAEVYADKGTSLVCEGKTMARVGVWMEVEAHHLTRGLEAAVGVRVQAHVRHGHGCCGCQGERGQACQGPRRLRGPAGPVKYLGCDCFTLADLHHIPTLTNLMGTPLKELFETRPKVSAWVADIMARPAWAKVLAMGNRQ
ncbi:hypothetical protein NL676_023447 [Syzygium grande]|nr:hypothetical protein NL676_023447 [Syzygium grande]